MMRWPGPRCSRDEALNSDMKDGRVLMVEFKQNMQIKQKKTWRPNFRNVESQRQQDLLNILNVKCDELSNQPISYRFSFRLFLKT